MVDISIHDFYLITNRDVMHGSEIMMGYLSRMKSNKAAVERLSVLSKQDEKHRKILKSSLDHYVEDADKKDVLSLLDQLVRAPSSYRHHIIG